MAQFRYMTFDMKTFEPTSELIEVGDPQITYSVNEAEIISLTVPISPSEFSYVIDPQIYMPPRGGLAVEKDGVLIAAGPILNHAYDFRNGTVNLTAGGIFKIFERRFDNHNHHFEQASAWAAGGWVPAADNFLGWDQAFIARFFVREMQEANGGWLNIDVTGIQSTNSGYRDIQTFASGLKSYYEQLQDIADNYRGFDFRFFPRWENSARNSKIEWAFEIFYPATGVNRGLTFQMGSNCEFESATIDGTQIAFRTYSIGAQKDNSAIIGIAERAQYISADYLLEYVDRSHTDVTIASTAFDYARQAVSRRGKAINIPSLIVDISEIDNFVIGDQCRVIADRGIYQVDEMFRIMGYAVSPRQDIAKLTILPLSSAGVNDG